MGTKREPPPPVAPAPVKASESESYLNTRNLNLLKGLDSGKDVRDIAELNPNLQLFDSSVRNNQNYAGEGLLSTNALSGGNTGQLGLIGQQIAARKRQQAEGDLYNGVMGARDAATAGAQWGANTYNSREGGNADRQNQAYTTFLGKPKQPGLLGQILGGVIGAAGQIGAAGVTAGAF